MVFSERVRNYGSRGKGVSARDNHIIKGMKALHLLAALAWAGGAFSMQALGFLKLGMDDPATVKLVEYCRYIVDSWVVMPGLIGCVLTGLFYSIFTSLGFFKFAWVTIKWIISFCAGFWGTFFWLPVGDRCIEWLTPMGLDWPLRFVRSCILPEELGQPGPGSHHLRHGPDLHLSPADLEDVRRSHRAAHVVEERSSKEPPLPGARKRGLPASIFPQSLRQAGNEGTGNSR